MLLQYVYNIKESKQDIWDDRCIDVYSYDEDLDFSFSKERTLV